MNQHTNFLLFDLGGIIIDLDYQKTYDAFLPLLKTGFSSIDQKLIIDHATHPYEQGLISSELFINKLLSYCKPSVHAKQIINAWNAMLIDIPERRLHWLQSLARQQSIGILSNTNALHVEWVNQFLKKHYHTPDLYHYVPNTFFSHDLKDRKPNPSIYRKVALRLGMPTDQILFVDDNLENVSAALSVGMKALHSPPEIETMDQLQLL